MNFYINVIKTMIFNCIFSSFIKKLIMALVFHQICEKERCNNIYPFCIPLTAFSERGVCLLTNNERELFGFVCSSCGTQTFVNFATFVSSESLKYIREKETLAWELDTL